LFGKTCICPDSTDILKWIILAQHWSRLKKDPYGQGIVLMKRKKEKEKKNPYTCNVLSQQVLSNP
jgi:hypothetical protein